MREGAINSAVEGDGGCFAFSLLVIVSVIIVYRDTFFVPMFVTMLVLVASSLTYFYRLRLIAGRSF